MKGEKKIKGIRCPRLYDHTEKEKTKKKKIKGKKDVKMYQAQLTS